MPTPQRIELFNILHQFDTLHNNGIYHTDLDLRHIIGTRMLNPSRSSIGVVGFSTTLLIPANSLGRN